MWIKLPDFSILQLGIKLIVLLVLKHIYFLFTYLSIWSHLLTSRTETIIYICFSRESQISKKKRKKEKKKRFWLRLAFVFVTNQACRLDETELCPEFLIQDGSFDQACSDAFRIPRKVKHNWTISCVYSRNYAIIRQELSRCRPAALRYRSHLQRLGWWWCIFHQGIDLSTLFLSSPVFVAVLIIKASGQE